MNAPATIAMSTREARNLTDEVKADAQSLWRKLMALHDGRAHHALGYPSWGAYCAAEFDLGQSRAYQLLDAGRAVASLDAHSTIVERPASEGVARELAPVLRADGPEAAAQAWESAVQEHGPEPTAAQVRATIAPGPEVIGGQPLAHAEPRPVDHLARTLARKPQGDTIYGTVTFWADQARELPDPEELVARVPPGPGHIAAFDAALTVLDAYVRRMQAAWPQRRAQLESEAA